MLLRRYRVLTSVWYSLAADRATNVGGLGGSPNEITVFVRDQAKMNNVSDCSTPSNTKIRSGHGYGQLIPDAKHAKPLMFSVSEPFRKMPWNRIVLGGCEYAGIANAN